MCALCGYVPLPLPLSSSLRFYHSRPICCSFFSVSFATIFFFNFIFWFESLHFYFQIKTKLANHELFQTECQAVSDGTWQMVRSHLWRSFATVRSVEWSQNIMLWKFTTEKLYVLCKRRLLLFHFHFVRYIEEGSLTITMKPNAANRLLIFHKWIKRTLIK